VIFRYDYRINGRRGRYGDGISLAQAREKLLEAKKRVNAGISPAIEKRNSKTKRKGEKTFHDFTFSYMKHNNGAKPETHQTIVDMAMNGSGCRDEDKPQYCSPPFNHIR